MLQAGDCGLEIMAEGKGYNLGVYVWVSVAGIIQTAY